MQLMRTRPFARSWRITSTVPLTRVSTSFHFEPTGGKTDFIPRMLMPLLPRKAAISHSTLARREPAPHRVGQRGERGEHGRDQPPVDGGGILERARDLVAED